MATQVFHLEISSDRIDLVDIVKLISRKSSVSFSGKIPARKSLNFANR